MHILALLHRWAGGIAGLILAILGLSGAILVWEDNWIGVPHADDPFVPEIGQLARSVQVASAEPSSELSRITFADAGLGVHQAIYADGGGAYLSQAGEVVERWSSQWERPELWLFDLHHHLFMGGGGETLTGLLGLTGLFFVVSGVILWWRTRRTFKLRVWPARMTRSAIVRHHRDLGIVAAPLLLLVLTTGTLMVFDGLSRALLSPWSAEASEGSGSPPEVAPPSPRTDWEAVFHAAQARFPDAAFRRLQFPREVGAPVVLRMKQPSEWTPNGRTYLYIDPVGVRIIGVEDPTRQSQAKWVEEKYYPVHSAKVGGTLWKIAISLTGLVLLLLGTLAVYGFWFRKGKPS